MNRDRIRQAQQAAHDSVNQATGNVRNLRRTRNDSIYDANTERRTLTLDAYEASLVVIALDDLGTQAGRDLALRIRDRFAHPSSVLP